MNWRVIANYTILLFLARFLVGFLDGLLSAPATDPQTALWHYAIGNLASFLMGAAIFALLVIRQANRPCQHAAFVLLAYVAISLPFDRVVAIWLPTHYPSVLAAIDWLVLLISFLSGTFIGQIFRRRCPVAASRTEASASQADA